MVKFQVVNEMHFVSNQEKQKAITQIDQDRYTYLIKYVNNDQSKSDFKYTMNIIKTTYLNDLIYEQDQQGLFYYEKLLRELKSFSDLCFGGSSVFA